MQDKYDSAFLGILQSEGEISKFLDSFFSFLYRKTDFYIQLNSPSDQLGFPPGVARRLAQSAFQKYEAKSLQDQKRRLAELEKCSLGDLKPSGQTNEVPEVAHEEEVIATTTTLPPTISTASCAEGDVCSRLCNKTAPQAEQDVTAKSENQIPVTSVDTISASEGVTSDKDQNKNTEGASRTKQDMDTDPELTRLQKVYQANPESYNGAIRDKYSWSQSITDVDVMVQVPEHIRKGKDVTVQLERKHLKVACKDLNGQTFVIVDGDLTWECHKDELVWSLVPGEHVHVNLEKVEERWWDALLTDEPKISVRKIDPSRPITDLDDEAQAKIEEMMYNEQQKRLGLPQTHEMKVHDMLAKAWDAEGSPFKGQPFDPSKISIAPSGMMQKH